MNTNRKSIEDTDDLIRAWDRSDRWDVIGLQEILTTQGHIVPINRRRDGCFSTAIAIYRRFAGLPREVRHDERCTVATIRVPTMTTKPLQLQVCSLHLPSAVGHDGDEIGTIMRDLEQHQAGKISVRLILGDINHVLCDHREPHQQRSNDRSTTHEHNQRPTHDGETQRLQTRDNADCLEKHPPCRTQQRHNDYAAKH